MLSSRASDLPKVLASDLDEIEGTVTASLDSLLRATNRLRAYFAGPSIPLDQATADGLPHPLHAWIQAAYHFWLNTPDEVPPEVRTFWTLPAIRRLWPPRLTIKRLLRTRVLRPVGPPPSEIAWTSVSAAQPGITFMLRDDHAHRAFIVQQLRRGLPRGAAGAKQALREYFASCRKDADRRPALYQLEPRSQQEVNETVRSILERLQKSSAPEPSSCAAQELASPADPMLMYQVRSRVYNTSPELRRLYDAREEARRRDEERGKSVSPDDLWRPLKDRWPNVLRFQLIRAISWALDEKLLKTDPEEIEYGGKKLTFATWDDLADTNKPPVVLRTPKPAEAEDKPLPTPAGGSGEQLGGEVANMASKARCRGRSPRRGWVTAAVSALMAVVFGVTASMVAADLRGWLGQWWWMGWVLCGVSAIFAIGAAVCAKRRAGPLGAAELGGEGNGGR